ncbi:CHAD domain-containing protein [Siculibacillus lacustris]|uniref:CHAD domain-containing protein n=1 Tax=Siculibacillus lacustris TaxID=1549641 RepID=A0A4Q9VXK9_9HYPH|nr:CHAD domain-containing protein [Siculibacillus lacustris]TBW41217.1 CHAD domain-containing protein [Siculibacillus lacustris]
MSAGATASAPIQRTAVGKARFLLLEGETLAQALKRVLIGEITGAAATLVDPAIARSEAIHLVRRRLKRARSLFEVLEDVPGANQKGRTRQIRDTGRLLAAGRDADVLAAGARRLKIEAAGQASEAATRLVGRLEVAARLAHAEAPPLDAVVARLRASEADARSLPERFEAGRLLAEALGQSYRQGRRDWCEIADGVAGERLHDWRKRVKQRRHLSVMVPFDTAVTTRSIQDDLEDLAEVLGEEHDLALMRLEIETRPGLVERRSDREALFEMIAHRRRKLLKTALAFGEELYGDRTRLFTRDLAPLHEI